MKYEERLALREAIMGYDPVIDFESEETELIEAGKIQESSSNPRRQELPFWRKKAFMGSVDNGEVDLEKEMNGKQSSAPLQEALEPQEKQKSTGKVKPGVHTVL